MDSWGVGCGAWGVGMLCCVAALPAQTTIVPRPAAVRQLEGEFQLRHNVSIIANERHLEEPAELLAVLLREAGVQPEIRRGAPRPGSIVLEAPRATAADSEAYDVSVRPGLVHLRGGSTTGLIWAMQTFRQLLPPRAPGRLGPRAPGLAVQAVEIRDAPRFRWRGAMLDAGRHFYPVADVKRFIDAIARYKLNVFHWHLTDDQGWRIEILRYPRLTQVGAWRTEPDGSLHGGFYTQREIRDVVDYARRRGVTVVPEIEMPGHASAAIASYPHLGCADTVITVPNTWGVFPDVFCLDKPTTFTFLEQVLDEVTALFPSRYVHIGGDEAPNIPDSVQQAFTRRMAAALERRGRVLVGWDEIVEGGVPPGLVVQAWRGMAYADTAARAGVDVIASPDGQVYLNASPATTPLDRVYAFEPVPPGLDAEAARHILGAEATLWSEHIDAANLDLLAWPRLLALAEAAWSSAPRDFAGFRARLEHDQYARLRAMGITPGPENRHVLRMTVRTDTLTGAARIVAEAGVSDLEVRYAVDGEPDPGSPRLDSTITFSRGVVSARAFINGRGTLYRRRLTFEEHAGRGRPVTLSAPPRPRYPGTGPRNLTDGLTGSDDFDDGLWQGWLADFEATVDLGAVSDVKRVLGSFLQNTRSWILFPRGMVVSLSDDGRQWIPAGGTFRTANAERLGPWRDRLAHELPPGTRARFVRVQVLTAGPLPAWHGGAGNASWVFMDELVIQ